MDAYFNSFTITMTKDQAEGAAHQGRCDDEVEFLAKELESQLDKIPADDIRRELKEYRAWDAEELADEDQNRLRIVWIAAGNIRDDLER